MARALNLRQIEIFKAVIDHGTVSRASEVLNISQPAASKLLMQLERENGLKLFDRNKGRLVPTAKGLRLHEEIDRIFVGLRQVESAIDFLKREDQGRLIVGVPPGLTGAFIQRSTMNFLKRNPNVACAIQSVALRWIPEHVGTRKLDVGVVTSGIDNPYVVSEPLLKHPLLCIMPLGHPLASQRVVRPRHLNGTSFVAFSVGTYTGQKVSKMLEDNDVSPNIVLTADTNPSVCEFVAGGLGVSLVQPLFIVGMSERLVARPFAPEISFDNILCYARDAPNAHLISEFVTAAQATAASFIDELTGGWA